MEYIIFWCTVIVFIIIFMIYGAWNNHNHKKWFRNKLLQSYGKDSNKEYKIERFIRISSYFEKHKEKIQIDDITWNDLNMDEIFKKMDFTLS